MNILYWTSIPEYEGLYSINRNGEVLSNRRTTYLPNGSTRVNKELILKSTIHNKSTSVNLYKNGIAKTLTIGYLMLKTFGDPQPKDTIAAHIDRNCQNNKITNLYWKPKYMKNNIEYTIKNIISLQLGIAEDCILLNHELEKDLGGDSLDTVELLLTLESEYKIDIPDDEAEKFNSVKSIIKYITNTVGNYE